MIASIRNFFRQLSEPGVWQAGRLPEQPLQVATAALLLETMRMDDSIAPEETTALTAALRKQFGLTPEEINTLVALAGKEVRQASGYYQFTSLINKGFDSEQKIQVIEQMWAIAFADGYLHAQEQHLIRKIADLLYVPHAQYIEAKHRARAATVQSAVLT
jgi:uncharacterized tellurite resistance protein B-like protein